MLLGTKGGPTPGPFRAAPATLVEVDGKAWVVDCGNGVANQLAKARVRLDSLSRVFVTHNHSDHVADVGTLIELAWSSGLKTPVWVHGPPPIGQIVRDQLAALSYDVEARIREEGRIPLAPLVHVDERASRGVVVRDGATTVTSCLVDHETVKPAFAYRFDTPARSVVISGDTAYSDALIALAKGADLLIHEAIYAPAIPGMAGENAPTLADHLRRSHTSAEDVGPGRGTGGREEARPFAPRPRRSAGDRRDVAGRRAHQFRRQCRDRPRPDGSLSPAWLHAR